MRREPTKLANNRFDVLVIGAGIHGACIAREAALQGLSVALVDRGDFGGATSANSLKVVHGGLRYLQTLDIRRMRESVRERRTLMRIAPHLVSPMPFVIPTQGLGKRSRTAMRVAFRIANWIAPDKCGACDPHDRLPRSRVLSRRELIDLFPDLSARNDITGGALWYDCQVYNTERLTLAFVRDAVERGATAVNYMETGSLIVRDGRVVGAKVHDRIADEEFEVRADLVVNAAGPWMNQVLGSAADLRPQKPMLLSKAWNVVTRSLHPTHALGFLSGGGGLSTRGDGRMLFITPWRGKSIIGTMYTPADENTSASVTDEEVECLIDNVNSAYPGARLSIDDVDLRHGGLLPVRSRDSRRGVDELADRSRIIDHQRENDISGLLSVYGVKYTTARLLAERVVERICKDLRKPCDRLAGSRTPIDGGNIENLAEFSDEVKKRLPGRIVPSVDRLVRNYGTRVFDLADEFQRDPESAGPLDESSEITRAEVLYAIRTEMGVTLADIVLRRTDLGSAGHPGEDALRACAEIMAKELGWDARKVDAEIGEVTSVYSKGIGDSLSSGEHGTTPLSEGGLHANTRPCGSGPA